MERETIVLSSSDLPAAAPKKPAAAPRKSLDDGKTRRPSSGAAEGSSNRPKRLAFLEEIRARGRLGSHNRPTRPNLGYINELADNRKAAQRYSSVLEEEGMEMIQSPMVEESPYGQVSRALKTGSLIKTSKSTGPKAAPGLSRQRKFRLTNEALEYFHTFSHVKVKRSYPLTAVEKIEYDGAQNPATFKLVFSTYVLSLQAENGTEAKDWVDKIRKAWSQWVITDSNSEDEVTNLSDSDVEAPFDESAFQGTPHTPSKIPRVDNTGAEAELEGYYQRHGSPCDSAAPPTSPEPCSPGDGYVPVSHPVGNEVFDEDDDISSPKIVSPTSGDFTSKPHEDKSFGKLLDGKIRDSSSSFSKPPEGKIRNSTSSFSKPPEGKIRDSTSSFSKPTEGKIRDSTSSFSKPTEGKIRDSTSSFSKPPEGKIQDSTSKSPSKLRRGKRFDSTSSYLRRERSGELEEFPTYDARKRASRRAFKIARLRPQLERTTQHANMVNDPHREHDPAHDKLHKEFSMIKYPSKILRLPAERVFTVDRDNLQILWKTIARTGYRQSSSLSLRRIVEVRQGQRTPSFDKFPYEQVENQSFSLMFESETSKYAKLSSLDVICDHTENFNEWMEALSTLVSSSQWLSLYPPRYENTDPLILWLKMLWTCKSENNELKQPSAIKLAKKFIPQLYDEQAKLLVKIAHDYQIKHTFNLGAALRWDGFVLLFHLLCDRTDLQLHAIFKSYALQHPELGLTIEEFRRFLIVECHWLPTDTKPSVLHTLMKVHDEEHHQAIKKFTAKNQPKEFLIASKLLSFAGFLSFLRSKDNPVINLEHETVYQDMTQPLSHYFINSSHNTYLEGDQLTGTSSTDAYVRTLLQGCRCIEIDCWDGVRIEDGLQEREPVIYHGYTLTTKIAFRDVIHAINDTGFTASIYPIIISIENHCSSSQQSRMAKVFRAIFGDRLPKDNLVELENRERLPSPEELQGKVILKGTFHKMKTEKKAKKTMQKKLAQFKNLEMSLPIGSKPRSPTRVNPSGSLPTKFKSPFRSRDSTPEIEESTVSITTDPESSLSLVTVTPKTSQTVHGTSSAPTELKPSPRLSLRSSFNRRRGHQFKVEGEDLVDGRPFRRGSVRRQDLRDRLAQHEQGYDDQELVFSETEKDLKALIVYCRAVSIKPWNWNLQKETTVSEMFSFGEPTAVELCKKFSREVLCCTERQLVRTYPKGTRFDSSNYDPFQMWNCGIQMVALNFQYPGLEMHLNQGFFRLNGGCGYVLKPKVMRVPDPGGSENCAPFSADMMVPHPAVTPIHLEIELLSGQRLSSWKKKFGFVSVDIQSYGIRHDCAKMKQATSSNTFWPSWAQGEHVFEREIFMPELCLIYIRVENEGKRIYGQNCFPVISLVPGIKFIPLRTNGGEMIPESGIFVRIKKTEGGDLGTITEEGSGGVMSKSTPRSTPLVGRKPPGSNSPQRKNRTPPASGPLKRAPGSPKRTPPGSNSPQRKNRTPPGSGPLRRSPGSPKRTPPGSNSPTRKAPLPPDSTKKEFSFTGSPRMRPPALLPNQSSKDGTLVVEVDIENLN